LESWQSISVARVHPLIGDCGFQVRSPDRARAAVTVSGTSRCNFEVEACQWPTREARLRAAGRVLY
jgi:hypothetical protein